MTKKLNNSYIELLSIESDLSAYNSSFYKIIQWLNTVIKFSLLSVNASGFYFFFFTQTNLWKTIVYMVLIYVYQMHCLNMAVDTFNSIKVEACWKKMVNCIYMYVYIRFKENWFSIFGLYLPCEYHARLH